MEVAKILRELWRRRAHVGLVAIAALVAGLMVSFRVSLLPPKLENRSYEVGVATARMLVDTPNSQVIAVSPRGSDTLGARASLLSTLMTEGSVKADIARRVGLGPRQLAATAEFGPGSQAAAAKRKPGPEAHLLMTRVLTNTVGEQLPIIEVEAQAPNTEAAARLAQAAVSSLSESLDSRAASEEVSEARRLRVSPLGPPQVQEAGRGPRRLLGLVAAAFLFAAGCGLIVLLPSLARSWREVDASELSSAERETAGLDDLLGKDLFPRSASGTRRGPPDAPRRALSVLPGREDEDGASSGRRAARSGK